MSKRYIDIKNYFLENINPVIRYLIISDIMMVGAAAMFSPIFALFIEDKIQGGNAATAGVAVAIYLLTKSIFQIPAAAFIDKIRGEKDDYNLMVFFSFCMSLVLLLYLVVTKSWHLYAVQFLLGLFTAMTFPSYMAIFTRHIDKNKEGTEWGIYFTLTDLSSSALAAIGGYIAYSLGYEILIITIAYVSLIGAFILIPIKPYIKHVKQKI
jgi:MFS family permease